MHPSYYRFLNRPFTRNTHGSSRNACGPSGNGYGSSRSAHGLYWGMAGLSVVCSLCLLGSVPSLNAEPAHNAPSVPAGVQAPLFTPGKYPYRLTWGANTVVAEVAPGKDSDDGGHQVRIVDASGRLLRRIGADQVEDVRLVKPIVAGEQGLFVGITGGNSGLADYYGFGKGAFGKGVVNRFCVSGAMQVDVKDLNEDGTAEIIAIYRLEDIDGGGEHHGPRVTVVYQWNGTKYVEATRSFPALTRAGEKEDQSALAAIEAKASQSNAIPGSNAPEIDGHLNAVIGYLANAIVVGDGAEAQAWLRDNVSADRLHLPSDVSKSVFESVQSMLSPLAQDAGDDSQASIPAPAKAAPKATQRRRITAVVPSPSLGILKIGAARADVIAAIKMRPVANYDLKHGLIEDEWSAESTDGFGSNQRVIVWYREGKVVQAQASITEKQKENVPSFNMLIAGDRGLKEVCYYMGSYDGSQPTGGDNFYCFDDVKKGIAYGIGVNGDAYMTNKPDTLIIHAPGVAYIPFQGNTNVTRVTGAGDVLYQNQAEEDRAYALEKKFKSSQARSHKKY